MTNGGSVAVDLAVVGGGLAGAAVAARVAQHGRRVVILERSPRWGWHASGVFASPAALDELRSLGLADRIIEAVARPVPAMVVETAQGTVFRLTYGAGDGRDGAVGFDRQALDGSLLELASAAGAEILRGHTVERVVPSGDPQDGTLLVRGPKGRTTIRASVIAGADGARSIVARDVGVARPARLGRRVGLSWHTADPAGDGKHEARMVVLDGAYCGLAPVPGGRLNVGIVLAGRDRLADLAARGAATVGTEILDEVLQRGRPGRRAVDTPVLDAFAGAAPLGHRVTRRAGPGWLLVGDAAGFLDPFTGEGLHRALVSARLAGMAVGARPGAFDPSSYTRAMDERFGPKDRVSLLVQAFLAHPRLFDYAARRLARRERLRETLGLVMADLLPAARALDPRFIAAVLAP